MSGGAWGFDAIPSMAPPKRRQGTADAQRRVFDETLFQGQYY